ncbi:heavy metal translocating P-type ATPase [Thalassotalea agarivorans]|uniref:P-type Cu(2+) transporter n=1 Tax=Thalassotalea agarivorans TaxID=349064 RepID=A0A1I0HF89_THASX|nr:heavy metal translocating P-type ATPase [Thalassotalea agarivorans]SET81602.1 Cu2+-exporting ATPase [Thalassotalea agarivorans]
MSSHCYHCNEPIPAGLDLSVNIEGTEQAMCCIGCQAVAQTIVDNDLTDFYRYRTEPSQKSDPLVPEQLAKNKLLDDESLQSEFTFTEGDHKETILTVEGISCAACAWLIEMQLSKLDGVVAISVNATTRRANVSWQESKVKLSEVIEAIDTLGYTALPFKANHIESQNKQQAKTFIRRLGVSGILMMQVMMIAVGLYFGAFSDMSDTMLVYLRWTSMLLTLPIIAYGAFPFYSGAFRALKAKRLSMDVPVSIAILLAYFASCWATISQQGEVYFESVSMFTFLLLIGKFLEFRARSRAAEMSANLLKLMPMTATRIIDGTEQYIPAKRLTTGDMVLVKPGETVPADAIIVEGESQLNESMLSGEPLPVKKQHGEKVFAGTINGDGVLTLEVLNENNTSFLSQLIRLSERAQNHKPRLAQLSDKIAQHFVAIILLTAIGTAFYWSTHAPEEAFWITLSVLVATCPCALSLATPTALTCGTTRLNREGIMVKAGHVIETMPKVNHVAFDKTGTLTTGEFTINTVKVINEEYSETRLLEMAAALEAKSEHPIAKAFSSHRNFIDKVTNAKVHPGQGVTANLAEKSLAIGKPAWLDATDYSDAQCVLTIDNELAAVFYLADATREDAVATIDALQQGNIDTTILSGDSAQGCEVVAKQLSIDSVYSNQSAEQKMKQIQAFQQNQTLAMIGDGVNDTPVFGAAHVSIAMGSGTDVAKSGADVIFVNNHLNALLRLLAVAKKTNNIIKQNYGWAFAYNAIVLPLAVMGYITPYMAVIGMSASSILVISNSLRLLKK